MRVPSFILIAALILFAIGFGIAAYCFDHPVAKVLGGLVIGMGLCALAVGILYAGCMLMLKGI